jgi:hypothetical protein
MVVYARHQAFVGITALPFLSIAYPFIEGIKRTFNASHSITSAVPALTLEWINVVFAITHCSGLS